MDHVHSATDLASSSPATFFFTDTLGPKRLFGLDTQLDFLVANDTESEPVSTPSTATSTIQDACVSNSFSPWHIPVLSPMDSMAPGRWNGAATHLMVPPRGKDPVLGSNAAPAASWGVGQEQGIYVMPSNPSESEAEAEPLPAEFGTAYATCPVITDPREWRTAGTAWSGPSTMGNSPAVAPVLDSSFQVRKRRYDTEAHDNANPATLDSYEVLPQKGFNSGASDGFFKKAALSVNDTFDEPLAGDPKKTGMHCQSFLGPSYQQGRAMTSAQAKPPWVEGRMESMEGDAWRGVEGNPIQIPKNLDKDYRTLLAATEADWERGTIQVIMCRLCPGTAFRAWEHFKRHCDTAETHPLKIDFCDRCGDFFARRDSLRRHRNKPPLQCRNAKPEESELKRRATEKAHKEFKEKLERGRKTGEDVGIHFAQFIKKMFPRSSKKRSTGVREQGRFLGFRVISMA